MSEWQSSQRGRRTRGQGEQGLQQGGPYGRARRQGGRAGSRPGGPQPAAQGVRQRGRARRPWGDANIQVPSPGPGVGLDLAAGVLGCLGQAAQGIAPQGAGAGVPPGRPQGVAPLSAPGPARRGGIANMDELKQRIAGAQAADVARLLSPGKPGLPAPGGGLHHPGGSVRQGQGLGEGAGRVPGPAAGARHEGQHDQLQRGHLGLAARPGAGGRPSSCSARWRARAASPTPSTFSCLISACERGGHFERALDWFQRMQQSGVAADGIIYRCAPLGEQLIWDAVCPACEPAFWSTQHRPAAGWAHPHADAPWVVRSSLVAACIRKDMLAKAMELLDQAHAQGTLAPSDTYARLLQHCCRGQHHQQATEIFLRCRQLVASPTTSVRSSMAPGPVSAAPACCGQRAAKGPGGACAPGQRPVTCPGCPGAAGHVHGAGAVRQAGQRGGPAAVVRGGGRAEPEAPAAGGH